jgi:hypothetical protein
MVPAPERWGYPILRLKERGRGVAQNAAAALAVA